MSEIKIDNVGPVEHLEVPILEDGGIVVLTGGNGRGKDLSIAAVRRALGSSDKIGPRDGEKFGTVSVPGISLTVTGSVRKKGVAEVSSISGEFDYAEFVDPVKKSPEAADSARISLLCKIRGIQPDRAMFEKLVGKDVFDDVASSKTLSAATLVDMAQWFKADLERRARDCEDAAKTAEGKAMACDEEIAGVDMTAPSDPAALQAALETAVAARSEVYTRKSQAEEAVKRIAKARTELEQARERYDGPNSADCAREMEERKSALEDAEEEVDRIQKLLLEARQNASSARREFEWAQEQHRVALKHEQLVSECERTLSTAASIEPPSAEDLSKADALVERARVDLENGAMVRAALERRSQGAQHRRSVASNRQLAGELRGMASGCLDVLTEAIGSGSLYIEDDHKGNPRFMVDHPRRGATYYHDLSDGEKWRYAIMDGIRVMQGLGMEPPYLFPLPQRAWEGLDWENQQEVVRAAVDNKITIFTARAAREGESLDLNVEVHEGESHE